MRFIIAFVALLAGAVCLATGIAQRTILVPDPQVSASVQVPNSSRYVVLPASALQAHPGQPTLTVSGGGTVFAAYSSNANVQAWLHGKSYQRLNFTEASNRGSLKSATAPTLASLPSDTVTNPEGSDLWLDERRASNTLSWNVNLADSASLLIASDGSNPAPKLIVVTWPVSTAMPLALPLIWAGGGLLLIGLLLYGAALLGVRRKGAGRHSRVALVAPVAALALLSGSVVASPAQATPLAAKASTPAVSLTTVQAERIIRESVLLANQADSQMDATLLAQRFEGPALDLREGAYTLKKKLKSAQLPEALPASGISRLVVPEATAAWPRSLFAVLEPSDAKLAPLAVTFMQASPRLPYKISSVVQVQPNADIPALPAADKGATRLANNTNLLTLAPEQISTAYGKVLRDSKASEKNLFDTSTDTLYTEVGPSVKQSIAKALGVTADISYSDNKVEPSDTTALSTADSGALVSVYVEEQWQVKPNRKGVTIKPSGQTVALSGVKSTKKGLSSTYGYQLLFSVPAVGSNAKIELLGFSQGLIASKEL